MDILSYSPFVEFIFKYMEPTIKHFLGTQQPCYFSFRNETNKSSHCWECVACQCYFSDGGDGCHHNQNREAGEVDTTPNFLTSLRVYFD